MLSLEVFWLQACIVCDNKKFCFRLNIWLSGNEVIVLFFNFFFIYLFLNTYSLVSPSELYRLKHQNLQADQI